MSWLERVSGELSTRGVAARDRRRILLELQDHIECEPGCEERLGDPVQLASTFADELATHRTRNSAFFAFAALAVAAIALVVSQLAIGSAGGYPGFNRGLSQALFWPALLGMVVAPQIALVAGTLAALRAFRRRAAPSLPAAELALIRRRAGVGVGAGFATVAGVGLYVVNFSSILAGWWVAMVAWLALAAGATLLVSSRALVRAGAIASGMGGAAGDVFDDLPVLRRHGLRDHPWRLGLLGSVVAGLAMSAFTAHAEHSLLEGIQRGVPEGLAAGIGFVLLGRAVGLVPPDRGAQRH